MSSHTAEVLHSDRHSESHEAGHVLLGFDERSSSRILRESREWERDDGNDQSLAHAYY